MFNDMRRLLISVAVMASCFCGCTRESPKSPDKSGKGPVSSIVSARQQGATQSGEALFKQFCASCHPDGGNVSDQRRTLYASSLRDNRIYSVDDIIRIMRNPISRMIRFDASTLSDADAVAIAEYVLNSFK
ncbi:MAG TPA: c-type cytochrome [Desulfuromonadales bacterium]|nr:c-type cytochrome [Desulfuromonadales bacterium]